MMQREEQDWREISLLIFGLRIKLPEVGYYDQIRNYLNRHSKLAYLNSVIGDFPNILQHVGADCEEVESLQRIPALVKVLLDWVSGTDSDSDSKLREATSGVVVLPLLALIQITQYFNFLQTHNANHADLVSHVQQAGGVQGYCGGLLIASAVASSGTEEELLQNAAVALRLAFVIGVFGEIGDNDQSMMAVRLKQTDHIEELIQKFPGLVIAAVNDPKSVTVSGSTDILSGLTNYARTNGMRTQGWPIGGRWHHPKNSGAAQSLSEWCKTRPGYEYFTSQSAPRSLQSSRTGQVFESAGLAKDMIFKILVWRSDWHSVLTNAAASLKDLSLTTHKVLSLGIGDCTPLVAFNDYGLRISKVDGYELFCRSYSISEPHTGKIEFPDNTVAIVGASCRLPGANNLEELWTLLSDSKDLHQELPNTRFDLHDTFRASQARDFVTGRKFYANLLTDIQSFDHLLFAINPREAASMDPQQRILLETAYEAMESCGYLRTDRRKSGDRVACFIGAGAVDYHDNTSSHAPTAYTSTGTLRSFLCGKISHHFGWTGPSEVIDTACSSSLVAIARACSVLQSGDCSMALAGGVNIMTSPQCFFDLGRAGFLSPTGQCKPFDSSADGYCRSDGAGLVVLKLLGQAKKDSDHILGLIPGFSTNQGGLSPSITVPYIPALTDLYNSALRKAALEASHVSYVEAHASGTQVGDPIEMESIRQVFGRSDRSEIVHVGSLKGNIGHCETAAGVAGLLKVIAMLNHHQIPAQSNFGSLNPKIPSLTPNRMAITTKTVPWHSPYRVALVNGYGAAGSNSALIVCPPPSDTREENRAVSKNSSAQPIILSAATRTSLQAFVASLGLYLSVQKPLPAIENIAYTINSRRKRHRIYTVLSAPTTETLSNMLSIEDDNISEIIPCNKSIVLTLSGQSRRYVGLSRTFYEQYAKLRTYLRDCDNILIDLGFPPVTPSIFQTAPIMDTVVLQCGLVASQIAIAQCWIDVGLKVDAVVGHSLGELAALAVCGILSLRDCLKLVAGRAQLTKTKWGDEKGAMLVIDGSRREVEDIIKRIHVESSGRNKLEIACYNSPSSQVVVGTHAATEDMVRHLAEHSPGNKGVARRLDTDFGFHSELTIPILDGLDKIAESLEWNSPKIPLEVCRESGSPSTVKYEPSGHARKPVFFSDTIQRIQSRLGACLWLEAGMNTPIIPMVERAVSNKSHSFFSLNARDESLSVSALSDMVMRLWRAGVDVDSWVGLESSTRQIWLPPYQFEKTSHWLENIDRAAEIQRQALQNDPCSMPVTRRPAPQMVMLKSGTRKDAFPVTFTVDTSCDRFSSVLNGHRVCQLSMSPASLYIECISMALFLLDDSLRIEDLQFRQIAYQSPLGPDATDVSIYIQKSTSPNAWKFSIRSSGVNRSNSDVLHATGEVMKGRLVQYDLLHRLFVETKHRLDQMTDCEVLFSDRAYRMFSGVVQYDLFYKGIRRICLGKREACANVELPAPQPGEQNNPARHLCESVVIDIFIQVLGLLVNSSDLVPMNNVMVGAGIESASFSSNCQMGKKTSWKVYATFVPLDETQILGDVMVYSTENVLVGVINGCRFSRLSIARLEKLLTSSNGRSNPVALKSSVSKPSLSNTSSNTIPSNDYLTPVATTTPSDSELANLVELKQLAATYTGMADSRVSTKVPFENMGLDSLAAQELANDLKEKFGIRVQATDLPGLSLEALLNTSNSAETPAPSTNEILVPATNQSIRSCTPNESLVSKLEILQDILRNYSGSPSTVRYEETLSLFEIGIDSLASMELKQEISKKLAVETKIDPFDTVGSLVAVITANLGSGHPQPESPARILKDSGSHMAPATPLTHAVSPISKLSDRKTRMPNAIRILRQSDTSFEATALKCGFKDYWKNVAPLQNELLLAYITEAFAKLNVPLEQFSHGQALPALVYNVKHSRLMDRLCSILQEHDIIRNSDNVRTRGAQKLPSLSSLQLHQKFVDQHPLYACEAGLMASTGSRLAECLSGRVNPMDCLFGSSKAWEKMEEFYYNAPFLSTAAEQLVAFVVRFIKELQPIEDNPLKILEVGAGTGGTTKRLVKALSTTGLPVRYTFTDIAPSLVRRAKTILSSYDWVDFRVLDLEKTAPTDLHGQFDLVIGTNTVHATSDRSAVMNRLKDTMTETGFAVISETTKILDWCDLIFGLLDGWWLAEGGLAYPLQPAGVWMEYFRNAGFKSYSYSGGVSAEAHTQQLLLACKDHLTFDEAPLRPPPSIAKSVGGRWKIQTLTYKSVEGIGVDADLYLPVETPYSPMSIVLLIHGGGGLYLSKKSVRYKQIAYLLSQNILPISLNYRLCPETNLLDGAMTDICDAYTWARTDLPSLLDTSDGITLDSSNVAAIGYSTGGHLALSLAWTTRESNIPPPKAIVSFYAPVIFSVHSGLSTQRMTELPPRTMLWASIFRSLSAHPVIAHEIGMSEDTWLRTADPRAELIRAIFHEPVRLALLLNYIPCGSHFDEHASDATVNQLLAPPSPDRVRAICPLAHLEAGDWHTPTFIVHGDADDVAPFEDGARFFGELSHRGVDCAMSALKGVGHLFDLTLDVGDEAWRDQVAPALDFVCQRLK